MADQGFTKYISDFANVLKENGDDIMTTTQEVEDLFGEVLNFLTDDSNLTTIKTGVQTTIDNLRETLKAGEIFEIDELNNQFEDVVNQIGETINIDLNKPFNPDDILKSITELIPDGVFPDEIAKLYSTLKGFFNNIDVSDIRIGVKKINDPVPEVNTTTSTTTNQNASTNSSSSSTSFGKETTDPVLESLFNDFLENIINKITGQEILLDEVFLKLETAIIESGFYNELEEKKEEFINTITADGVTIPKIFKAVSQLLLDLIDSAIEAISVILEFIFEELKVILVFIKEELLSEESGSVITSIFQQFNPGYIPKVISVPAFLVSIPFTILTKATLGTRDPFPSFSLEVDGSSNIINGSLQISKTILPVIGLGSYKLSKDYKKSAIAVEAIGDILGLTFDILGQVYDNPYDVEEEVVVADVVEEDSNDVNQKAFWISQCIKIGLDFFNMIYKISIDYLDTETSTTLKHRVDKRTKTILVLLTLIELYNLIYLIYIVNTEVADEKDTRIKIGYYLDALPGILNGIISIAKIPKNEQLEQMEDDDKKLLTKLGNELDTAKTVINEISEIEKGAYNTFYIDNNGISDFVFLKNKLSVIWEVNNETRDLLKRNFEEQTNVVELKETLNRIIDKIDQLQEKISETQILISEHENKSDIINDLINAFNIDLPIIKYNLEESIEDYKSGIGDRITPTNENDIKLLKENFELKINSLNGDKKDLNNITIAIQQNELIRNFFFNSNQEVSVLLQTEEIIASLESLVVKESFIDNFAEMERDKLNAPILSMQSIAQELEFKKIEDPMRNQLGYYFPITEIHKGKIETIIAQKSKGLSAIAQFEERSSSKADLEKLNKEIARLDYGNILFNAVIQLTYGSLLVNAGIDPLPESE